MIGWANLFYVTGDGRGNRGFRYRLSAISRGNLEPATDG